MVICSKVESLDNKVHSDSLKDISKQLELLFCKNFILRAPIEYILRYPIYIKAMLKRVEQIGQNAAIDLKYSQQLQKHMKQINIEQYYREGVWADYRWSLEELRVSLFAQELKTKGKVSFVRQDKLLAKIL